MTTPQTARLESLSRPVFLCPGKLGQACAPLGNKSCQEPEPAQGASGSRGAPGLLSPMVQRFPVLSLSEVPDLPPGPLRPPPTSFPHSLLCPTPHLFSGFNTHSSQPLPFLSSPGGQACLDSGEVRASTAQDKTLGYRHPAQILVLSCYNCGP